MHDTRTETDFLGTRELPASAYYGIHSLRALENFPDNSRFQAPWYRAMGLVKLAVYKCYTSFAQQIRSNELEQKINFQLIPPQHLEALQTAAQEVAQGQWFEHFVVPAVQGGAGTSINLNVNEIIANRALELLGYPKGSYQNIDPIEQANIYQSTNDVVPTALTIAAMEELETLENSINLLRQRIERHEQQHRDSLRVAYTQLQAAVPSTFGKLFSTYNDALSRDWWRVSKCFERIKVVSLGGSAIGSSLAVPRFMVMELIPTLQRLTRQPIARGENLHDATSNLDSWVEVHGILKAHAVNLEKMSNDLRLLGSDFHHVHELHLPRVQLGSTIMPDKVNPVIAEFVISIAHKVYANDQLITHLAAQGMLELNAYLPLIGHALLESIQLLRAANDSLRNKLFDALVISPATARQQLLLNPAICTALSPYIGYHKAAELAKCMRTKGISVAEANLELNAIDTKKLEVLLQAQNLLKGGFSIHDLS